MCIELKLVLGLHKLEKKDDMANICPQMWMNMLRHDDCPSLAPIVSFLSL